jgi:hypothetical protein
MTPRAKFVRVAWPAGIATVVVAMAVGVPWWGAVLCAMVVYFTMDAMWTTERRHLERRRQIDADIRYDGRD